MSQSNPIIFPTPIMELPKARLSIDGSTAFVSEAEHHQVVFMHFKKKVELEEHAHEAQWGMVLEGRIDMIIDGISKSFKKGDHYFIPAGIRHSAIIHAGYTDITFFNEKRFAV